MPRGSELTDLQRGMVIGGHISGKSVRDVAALTGIPKSTVGNVVAKWKSTGSTEVASRSGRPAKITARGKRTLRRIVTGNMQATVIDVTEAFQESMGTSVSVNTVRKCIHELGYHNRADAHGTLRYSDSSGNFVKRHRGDPKKPRGKMSSYAYFVQTCRAEHKKKHPEALVNFSEFSKKCSERKEREKLEVLAKADKVRYETEMKSYKPLKEVKKKRTKDPSAPEKPMSAFFIFCSDHRPKITSENPDLSFCAVAKKLVEMWNSTSPEEKQPYTAKAAELKKKYKKDVAAYSTNEEDDVDKDEDDYVEDGDNFIMSKIKMMNKPE
ncbi:hypothetical protein HHUSO_G11794 [Huso huso]|uniref:HMG box domain-containing protein n=1 Tax=Huso huso TaxID=61971 RepID=A0ABR0ZMR7_HUSHU